MPQVTCSQCATVVELASFCASCGARLDDGSATPSEATPSEPAAPSVLDFTGSGETPRPLDEPEPTSALDDEPPTSDEVYAESASYQDLGVSASAYQDLAQQEVSFDAAPEAEAAAAAWTEAPPVVAAPWTEVPTEAPTEPPTPPAGPPTPPAEPVEASSPDAGAAAGDDSWLGDLSWASSSPKATAAPRPAPMPASAPAPPPVVDEVPPAPPPAPPITEAPEAWTPSDGWSTTPAPAPPSPPPLGATDHWEQLEAEAAASVGPAVGVPEAPFDDDGAASAMAAPEGVVPWNDAPERFEPDASGWSAPPPAPEWSAPAAPETAPSGFAWPGSASSDAEWSSAPAPPVAEGWGPAPAGVAPAQDWATPPPPPTVAPGAPPPPGFPTAAPPAPGMPPGYPPGVAFPGAPPPPPGGARSRKLQVIGGGVALLLVLTVAGWYFTRETGPAHPSSWDPKVVDLVEFVESERGLEFEQPVYVDFLSDAEFNEELGVTEGPTPEQKAEADRGMRQLRALGLLEGDVDLFAASSQDQSNSVVGLYDPESERLYVRGTTLDPFVRSVVVHELTHALQDQHFDLDAARLADVTGGMASTAVIEGDASRIESAWVDELSDDERAEYDEISERAIDRAESDDDEVPPILEALTGAPYALGEPWAALVATGNQARLDAAFATPPKAEDQIFQAFGYLDGDGPEVVERPPVPDGAEVIDEGVFGVLVLYIMLTQVMDPSDALTVVDGWGGDAYVSYEDGGDTCVVVDFVGDDAKGTGAIAGALKDWVAAAAEDAATFEETDAGPLRLTSCDPGAKATSDLDPVVPESLAYPVVRLQIQQELFASDDTMRHSEITCYANEIVQNLTLEDLQSEETTPKIERAIAAAGRECL